MISANTKNLIHAISIDGKVADRYFAVTSEVPKNTVDARISAMPLNGRSARAGAVRASGLFSGNGNEALSSLAAAAGGGGRGHGNLEGSNNRIGRGSKKRQLRGNNKVRKRDSDMREAARQPAAAGAADAALAVASAALAVAIATLC
jgi:hypothetical protein